MKVSNCRLCKGNLGDPVLKFPQTPIANEVLKERKVQDTFPLEICECMFCGHYQLNYSVPAERLFQHDYPFMSGTSPVNVEHFRKYAVSMVQKFSLKRGMKVLDIASNDGTLLKHFQDMGMQVLGIDPAKNIAEIANNNGVETIADFFTEEYADYILSKYGQFDLITANNVFAHMQDLIGFIKGVKKVLSPTGVFTFEVSYFADVCENTLFDTIYHEHNSYHTVGPLDAFFKSHGLNLFNVEWINTHGGSIRAFVSPSDAIQQSLNVPFFKDKEVDMFKKVKRLQKDIKLLGYELREKIIDLRSQGKMIAVYGVPAKATTLIAALGIDEDWIDFAVEDNPLKQNCYVPGKDIQIFSPQELLIYKPDVILVLAWNFADSIIKKCKDMGYKGRFIVPLPELREV